MPHRDSSIWGPYGAHVLAQFDRAQDSGDVQGLREQSLEDREEGLEERGRHNRVTEQIAAAHLDIAAEQQAAKQAVEAAKAHLATEQAVQVQQAAEAIVGLDPKKETYGRDLASVTGKYPYAFAGAANGLGEGLIKAVNSLNQQNEIWEHSEATRESHNDQLKNSLSEKYGVTPELDKDGNVDVDATRTKAEKARGDQTTPPGMVAAEVVQTDPVTGVKTTFKAAAPKIPAAVNTTYAFLQGEIAKHAAKSDTEKAANIKAGKSDVPYSGQDDLAGVTAQANALKQEFPVLGGASPAPATPATPSPATNRASLDDLLPISAK